MQYVAVCTVAVGSSWHNCRMPLGERVKKVKRERVEGLWGERGKKGTTEKIERVERENI